MQQLWNDQLCVFFLQVEFHPKLLRADLRSVCEEFGVCFQAFSSLGTGDLLTDPVVLEVAKQCGRTPAQVSTHATYSKSI